MEKLIELLGGWPEYFGEDEIKNGESLLTYLLRLRVIDEPVFGLVVRHAIHKTAFDKLSVEILDEEFTATATNYLSGKSQSRAFHENKLLLLERELLATPYARAKQGLSNQSTFLDLLEDEPKTEGEANVMPFKPLPKKGRR